MKLFGSGVIIRNKKILLLYHKKRNSWIQPGGKIDANETVIDGLLRELWEETGLKKLQLHNNPLPVMVFKDYISKPFGLMKWVNLRKKLQSIHQKIDWPNQAPIAIIENQGVVDLFYIFKPYSSFVKLNSIEHIGIRWEKINNLSMESGDDNILVELVPMLELFETKPFFTYEDLQFAGTD